MGTIYRNSTLYGGGGSGSGGHNILDTDGNSLPQEDNLQFKGLNVTDNSTDGITEVEALGLNQDDLDELSTEEITTGFIQSSFNYSTEEQIVGRWIDGKPIYQITITGTISSTGSNILVSNFAGAHNVDEVVSMIGAINYGTSTYKGWLPMTSYAWTTSGDTQTAYLSSGGDLVGGGRYTGPYRLTIQYTKTS